MDDSGGWTQRSAVPAIAANTCLLSLMLREALVQPGVDTIVRHQFVVCSAFYYFAVVEDEDLFGVTDGTQAMSHNKRRAATE